MTSPIYTTQEITEFGQTFHLYKFSDEASLLSHFSSNNSLLMTLPRLSKETIQTVVNLAAKRFAKQEVNLCGLRIICLQIEDEFKQGQDGYNNSPLPQLRDWQCKLINTALQSMLGVLEKS